MDREEESKKSEEKDNIEDEEEDKKEKQKSRKKSVPKNKKKDKTNRKSRKKKSEDIESGNSEEEQEKIEEDEVKEEVKGDEERRGVKYYKTEIETYLKKIKNKTMQEFWSDTIFKGVNYKYEKPPLNGWGKRQNFLFVRCGDMIRTENLAKDDYEAIENMPELVYYTITLYKNENNVKKNQPVLITILHLYFDTQIRLSTKFFNDWVLLNEIRYNKMEEVATGNFANKQIHEIYIKIKNENELPKDEKKKKNLDKKEFIAYLNDKIKLNNIANPEIKEI